MLHFYEIDINETTFFGDRKILNQSPSMIITVSR